MTTYLQTNKQNTFVKIHASYSLGGPNYFTGQTDPRGYYGYVRVVERTNDGGCMIESFTLFGKGSGFKTLLLEVKRQSPKAAKQAAEIWESKQRDIIARLLSEAGLTLTDDKEPNAQRGHVDVIGLINITFALAIAAFVWFLVGSLPDAPTHARVHASQCESQEVEIDRLYQRLRQVRTTLRIVKASK